MIIIKKNKITFDPQSRHREKEDVYDHDLPQYLCETVKIGKGVTFERIFDLIILHKDLFNQIFNNGCLHGHKIEMYLESYNKDVETTSEMTYMESCWGTDYWDLGKKKDREVYLYPSFHGIKEGYTDQYSTEPFDCPMGITSDISGYKNLPFKTNEYVIFQEHKDGKFKTKLDGKHEMDLFSMIKGILFEITFYGTPKNSEEFFDKMAKQVEDIKSGKADLYELKGKKKNGMPKFKKIKKKNDK